MRDTKLMSCTQLQTAIKDAIAAVLKEPRPTETAVREAVRQAFGINDLMLTFHPHPSIDGELRGGRCVTFSFSADEGRVRGTGKKE